MSRGVKDLRDLICVSRLTVRHSDEEYSLSDEELDGRLSQAFDEVSLGSSSVDSRQNSAYSTKHPLQVRTPDSGFGTNGYSQDAESTAGGEALTRGAVPHPPTVDRPSTSTRKKRKKKKKALETVPQRHELPKALPLPAVQGNVRPSTSSSDGGSSSPAETVSPPASAGKRLASKPDNPYQDGNFDQLLGYMDATLVSEWLEQANKCVTDLTIWIHTDENFVQFAHFFLTDFPDQKKVEIFKLEHSILLDSLQFAFAAGCDVGKVRNRDLTSFLKAVFREYPEKLLSSQGPYLFLDYLDLLTSERQSLYKRLLSDVKCSTRIKQYAQWILAVRSFALVSVWFAVVNFYRRLLSVKGVADSKALPVPFSTIGRMDANKQRIHHALRNGHLDVVCYLLKSNKVNVCSKDSHNKTLVFLAVTYNQPVLLKFLLDKMKLADMVNVPADNGNTPLHAAANAGEASTTRILLDTPGVEVDAANPQCEHATPLHLAAMHGHKEVVALLLAANANRAALMGDLSPLDIARDFGHDSVVPLLEAHS